MLFLLCEKTSNIISANSKMRRIKLILSVCFSFLFFTDEGYGQDTCRNMVDTILHKKVYTFAEQLPEPEGGVQSLYKLIVSEVRYTSKEPEVPGTIIFAFVVDTDGSIIGFRKVRGPSAGTIINQLAVIVSKLKWKPAVYNKKKVPYLYQVPMRISLQSSE